MNVAAIGGVIRAYRKASGLSQKDLAKLGGVSRATLNYLESGRDIEIGAGKLLALLDALGIPLGVPADVDRAYDDAVVEQAGKAITGKGRRKLPAATLLEALATGRVPAGFEAQVGQFMETAPEDVVLAAVRSASARAGVPVKEIWKKSRTLAKALDCHRQVWVLAS